MNDQHIARLEEQLERLVEGAFAQLFGKKITARDIALGLARSMENNIKLPPSGDVHPIAPDRYAIFLNPQIHERLLKRQPNLSGMLTNHIIELASQSGYQMLTPPQVHILAQSDLETGKIIVRGSHTQTAAHSTSIMQSISRPDQQQSPRNPQLIINRTRIVALEQKIINIGRSTDNQIILDDAHISRHHAQLRLRFGRYTLFDVQSRGGTFVNNVAIKEHRLQSGDVIRIGQTQIIYLEDDPDQPGTTQAMDPVEL